jgi:threonine/homoserine efflux transporter RhtA
VGFALLGQGLSAGEIAAITLVVTASAGALGSARAPAPIET